MAIAPINREMGTRRSATGPLSGKNWTIDDDCQRREQQHCLPCGACSCCEDTCGEPSCFHCESKHEQCHRYLVSSSSIPVSSSSAGRNSNQKVQYYTMCQIRRHNSENSSWIVVGDDIYDATPYINRHPGGKNSILRKSGGCVDCTQDFNFHSKNGKAMFRKYYVGEVCKCPSQQTTSASNEEKQWWMFWKP